MTPPHNPQVLVKARFDAQAARRETVHRPVGIGHRELEHGDDGEMLEIVLPADAATEEVTSAQGWKHPCQLSRNLP